MKLELRRFLLLNVVFYLCTCSLCAQYKTEKVITVNELFKLVRENHPSLKSYESDTKISKKNIEVAKNQLLPEIATGIQAYYLGDSNILNKDFSSAAKVDMPHFGNKFSIDARQLIWKGNMVRNGIKTQELREHLSELNYSTNEQNIKLLVLSYYLDLYKLYNQENVYIKNLELAEKRLENINKFYAQGMVTRNDVIRGELQISNIELAIQVVNNNEQILNKQLSVSLGLDDSIKILPDSNLKNEKNEVLALSNYESLATNHPSLKWAQETVNLYHVTTKITKAEMLPSISAFASNSMQRPIVTASPPMDMYLNGWSAGLGLSLNIDSFFKTPKKFQLNNLEKEKAESQVSDISQAISISVNTAYIKHNEAISQNTTLKFNTDLTAENYRIMESKYNNQLAILLELIDASNAKLDAELQFANSEINIIYTYYKLLKESGNLQ